MHTQLQRFIATILLLSMMFQSCTSNLKLDDHEQAKQKSPPQPDNLAPKSRLLGGEEPKKSKPFSPCIAIGSQATAPPSTYTPLTSALATLQLPPSTGIAQPPTSPKQKQWITITQGEKRRTSSQNIPSQIASEQVTPFIDAQVLNKLATQIFTTSSGEQVRSLRKSDTGYKAIVIDQQGNANRQRELDVVFVPGYSPADLARKQGDKLWQTHHIKLERDKAGKEAVCVGMWGLNGGTRKSEAWLAADREMGQRGDCTRHCKAIYFEQSYNLANVGAGRFGSDEHVHQVSLLIDQNRFPRNCPLCIGSNNAGQSESKPEPSDGDTSRSSNHTFLPSGNDSPRRRLERARSSLAEYFRSRLTDFNEAYNILTEVGDRGRRDLNRILDGLALAEQSVQKCMDELNVREFDDEVGLHHYRVEARNLYDKVIVSQAGIRKCQHYEERLEGFMRSEKSTAEKIDDLKEYINDLSFEYTIDQAWRNFYLKEAQSLQETLEDSDRQYKYLDQYGRRLKELIELETSPVREDLEEELRSINLKINALQGFRRELVELKDNVVYRDLPGAMEAVQWWTKGADFEIQYTKLEQHRVELLTLRSSVNDIDEGRRPMQAVLPELIEKLGIKAAELGSLIEVLETEHQEHPDQQRLIEAVGKLRTQVIELRESFSKILREKEEKDRRIATRKEVLTQGLEAIEARSREQAEQRSRLFLDNEAFIAQCMAANASVAGNLNEENLVEEVSARVEELSLKREALIAKYNEERALLEAKRISMVPIIALFNQLPTTADLISAAEAIAIKELLAEEEAFERAEGEFSAQEKKFNELLAETKQLNVACLETHYARWVEKNVRSKEIVLEQQLQNKEEERTKLFLEDEAFVERCIAENISIDQVQAEEKVTAMLTAKVREIKSRHEALAARYTEERDLLEAKKKSLQPLIEKFNEDAATRAKLTLEESLELKGLLAEEASFEKASALFVALEAKFIKLLDDTKRLAQDFHKALYAQQLATDVRGKEIVLEQQLQNKEEERTKLFLEDEAFIEQCIAENNSVSPEQDRGKVIESFTTRIRALKSRHDALISRYTEERRLLEARRVVLEPSIEAFLSGPSAGTRLTIEALLEVKAFLEEENNLKRAVDQFLAQTKRFSEILTQTQELGAFYLQCSYFDLLTEEPMRQLGRRASNETTDSAEERITTAAKVQAHVELYQQRMQAVQEEFGAGISVTSVEQAQQIKAQLQAHRTYFLDVWKEIEAIAPPNEGLCQFHEGNMSMLQRLYDHVEEAEEAEQKVANAAKLYAQVERYEQRMQEVQREFGASLSIGSTEQARQTKGRLQEHLDYLLEVWSVIKEVVGSPDEILRQFHESNTKMLQNLYAHTAQVEQEMASAEKKRAEVERYQQRMQEVQRAFGTGISISSAEQARQVKARLQEHVAYSEAIGPVFGGHEERIKMLWGMYEAADEQEQVLAYNHFVNAQQERYQREGKELNDLLKGDKVDPKVILAKAAAMKRQLEADRSALERYDTKQDKEAYSYNLQKNLQALEQFITNYTANNPEVLEENLKEEPSFAKLDPETLSFPEDPTDVPAFISAIQAQIQVLFEQCRAQGNTEELHQELATWNAKLDALLVTAQAQVLRDVYHSEDLESMLASLQRQMEALNVYVEQPSGAAMTLASPNAAQALTEGKQEEENYFRQPIIAKIEISKKANEHSMPWHEYFVGVSYPLTIPNVIIYQRHWQREFSTSGPFIITGTSIRGFFLEPPGPPTKQRNQNKRIPPGRYQLTSNAGGEKGGLRLCNHDVPDDRGILIHPGNFSWDTVGCLLPGTLRMNNIPDTRDKQKPERKGDFVGGNEKLGLKKSRELCQDIVNWFEQNARIIDHIESNKPRLKGIPDGLVVFEASTYEEGS